MRMRTILAGLLVLGLAWPALAQEPILQIVLTPGQASAVPSKSGVAYANGGIIDVARPDPTTIVATLTG